MGEHKVGFLLTTQKRDWHKQTNWVRRVFFSSPFSSQGRRLSVWSERLIKHLDLGSPRLWYLHIFNYESDAEREKRCIWVRLYCSSSSSTARLWARPCPLVPPWISTMWRGRGSRRSGVRYWASSGWRVPRSPSDRTRSPIRSKRCITAPRSYWRSWGGIGSKVAVRTTPRLSTMPRRYTNSTWSTDRQKAVSTTDVWRLSYSVFLRYKHQKSLDPWRVITHQMLNQCQPDAPPHGHSWFPFHW